MAISSLKGVLCCMGTVAPPVVVLGIPPATAHLTKTPTGSYNPDSLYRQGSTPDAVGPKHAPRLTIKHVGEIGPRSPGDTGHVTSRSSSEQQITREGTTFPLSAWRTRSLVSFTNALHRGPARLSPRAEGRSCDSPPIPRGIFDHFYFLNCAAPVSRVGSASCRGAS